MKAERASLRFPLAIGWALGALGALAALVLGAPATGCKGQSVSARSNFVEDGVQEIADAAWDGERIAVDNAGVTAGGGLAVTATDTDRVVATARMLAVADTTDKANADLTITAATNTFTIATTAGVTSVQCAHGTQNGSADVAESGCDALDVSIPKGTTDKRIAVAARSGNGKVGIAIDGAQVGELTLYASHGAIDVQTATTHGASITVVSDTGDDITLRLPPDFQADSITLDTAADKIDTSAFADVKRDAGRGQADAGAKLIIVRSSGPDGGSGRIVLVPIAPQ